MQLKIKKCFSQLKTLNNNIFYLFIIITFCLTLNHVPFWDEARAFDISCLKINELFYLAKIDGHTILWYLLLKPFNNIKFYPYSMLFLDWFFAILAFYIFYKKSKINFYFKTLILFSVPFLTYFAPVARGYGIALLFLFLVCFLYEKRFEKSYLFSLALILSANVEIVCSIACFYLGLTYLYEILMKKDYKLFYKILSIFFFGAILLIFQVIGEKDNNLISIYYNMKTSCLFSMKMLLNNALSLIYHLIFLFTSIFMTVILFKNNKKACFFFFGINITLLLIYIFVYCGCTWNYYFFFIYFIIALWLFNDDFECGYTKNRVLNIFLSISLILSCFPSCVNYISGDMNLLHNSKADKIATYFSTFDKYKNAKLYCIDWWGIISPGATTYLAKKGIKIYDFDNLERRSYRSMKEVYKNQFRTFDLDVFLDNIDYSKENYLITDGRMFNQKYCSKNKNLKKIAKEKFIFQEKNDFLGIFIYKIVK